MAQANAPLKAALATLDDLPGVTPADVRRITALIVDNPVLLDGFNRAAASGALKSFGSDLDDWSKASFGGGVMSLQVGDLLLPPRGTYDPMALTSTLAHEICHANDPRGAGALVQFRRDADAVAASPGPVHDYTPALTRYLDARRDREGAAELNAFNAVHAALVARGIAPTVSNMLKAAPDDLAKFVDPHNPTRWNPGLRLDARGALQDGPGNLALINTLYFHSGDDIASYQDYTHRYIPNALGYAVAADRNAALRNPGQPAPRVVVDYAFLGLKDDKVAAAGVYIYPPMRIYDRPTDPSPSHLITPRPPSPRRPGADAGDAVDAPPLLAQAQGAVERLDTALARVPDDASHRLAASMAALAQAHGFARIDHVMASQPTGHQQAGATAFVVEGEPGDGRARTARMPMAEALDPDTPARLAAAMADPAPITVESEPLRRVSMPVA